MAQAFDIIDYISGLTTFVLDESVVLGIAYDRDVIDIKSYNELDERTKDLLLADILFKVYVGAANIPSFQHQHGQFSTSTGQQSVGSKEEIGKQARALYMKWGDEKMYLIPTSSLTWME